MIRGLISCTRLILPDSLQFKHRTASRSGGALRAGKPPARYVVCLLMPLLLSADAMAAQIVSTWTFGGSAYDSGSEILIADDGCILAAGVTQSADFPLRTGNPGTSNDIYVVKFSPSGEQLWACFLGGSAGDGVSKMVLDSTGAIWLAGSTKSPDFPTPAGFDTTFAGGDAADAFIAKVSPDGELLFGTYLGGCGSDYATGIATDLAGNVAVVGSTYSGDFLLPDGQPVVLATNDIFVVKLTPDCQMEWTQRFGGSDLDHALSIIADSEGNILIGGYTYSPDFPFSEGQPTSGSTSFLLKLSPSGEWLWAAALGWAMDTAPHALAVDSANNALVAGGWYSAIVKKVSAAGEPQWEATIARNSSMSGIALAPDGSIIACGTTSYTFFPSLNMSELYAGWGFVARLSPTGQLLCCGRIGEADTSYAADVAVDSSGRAWLTGRSPHNDYDAAIVQFTFQSKLTVQSTPITGAEIEGDYPGVTNYTAFCQFGQVVDLQAPAFTPSGGANYRFVRWKLDGKDQPLGQAALQVTMAGDHVAIASYEVRRLSVSSSPPYGIDIAGDKPGCTHYTAMCDVGQEVVLTAPVTALASGYDLRFALWRIDNVDQAQGELDVRVTMDTDHTVRAVYDVVRCELSVKTYPSTNMTAEITGDRPGTTPYSVMAEPGEVISLTAPELMQDTVTGKRYAFNHWREDYLGDMPQGQRTVQVTMDRPQRFTAHYQILRHTLAVKSAPVAGIPMTASGMSGTPKTDFSTTRDDLDVATLTAPASASIGAIERTFVRWTLDGMKMPDGVLTLQVTMDDDHTAMASYFPPILTVTSQPAAGIAITGDVPGTTAYSAYCEPHETVNLTAPETATVSGHTYCFLRWRLDSADQPDGETSVQITMDDNIGAVAVYLEVCQLRVQSSPFQGLAIDGSASGVTNYTLVCDYGTTVNLSAPATATIGDMRYTFYRWFGVAGIPNGQTAVSFTVTSSSKTVIAEYKVNTHVLTVQSLPNPGVPITGRRSGTTNYTATCNDQEVVTLEAPLLVTNDGARFGFVRWEVDGVQQADNQRTVSITMDADRLATAHYAAMPFSVLVLANRGLSVPVTGDAPGTTSYVWPFAEDETVTLTVSPRVTVLGGLYLFKCWQLDGVDQPAGQTTLTFAVTGAHTAVSTWDITGDANGDCRVNILDLIFIRERLGRSVASGDNVKADVNRDGMINILDLICVRAQLAMYCQ